VYLQVFVVSENGTWICQVYDPQVSVTCVTGTCRFPTGQPVSYLQVTGNCCSALVINSPISFLSLTLVVTCHLFILSICLSDAMNIRLSRLIIDKLWNWQTFEHIPIALITRSLLGVSQHNGRAFETHACYPTRQVATTTPWEGL
jgi:hypothetical protein